MSEWLKVPLSKSGVVMSYRGFESHSLRRPIGRPRRPFLWKGRIAWPSARDWKSRKR